MADNTDHTTQGDTQPTDLLKFDRESSQVYGCQTGHHEFDMANAKLTPNGSLTQIALRCLLCGVIVVRNEMLNINELLDGEQPQPETTPNVAKEVPAQAQEVHTPPVDASNPFSTPGSPEWGPKVRARFQQDKESDEFWKSLK